MTVGGNGNLIEPLIPGDTVRMKVNFSFRFDGRVAPEQATIGDARVRFEFLVTLPEPSAALSLPIGALSLLGLASLRG